MFAILAVALFGIGGLAGGVIAESVALSSFKYGKEQELTKRKRKVPKVKRLKSQRKKARRRRKRLSFLLRAKATSPLPNPTTVICSLYQFTKISYFLMVNSQYGWN